MMDKCNSHQPYEHVPRVSQKPQTIIVVYDQPKVIVVRRYTRTIVTLTNPDEYQNQFDTVLLDTSALLDLARRLNIEENMITLPSIQ
ncbi:unnamed protein product [Rotaria magnacalcarata]|nr:unnamed protein product [Rotaria magnacalcarata]CAF1219569.1 unnamed protein product [Rotaria magnacalcarata]CAF1912633.1 unnamed protein product [Rotaria magnacalcarata]CAF1927779.1 unnamed protein product [Rotaria magnacalcarata]CAF3821541.1 unnamed protein product [Rotaria magnacalcarata]